jgi:hypothetical protein
MCDAGECDCTVHKGFERAQWGEYGKKKPFAHYVRVHLPRRGHGGDDDDDPIPGGYGQK